MNEYRTVKDLIIETIISNGGDFPSYVELSALVKKNFPHHKWAKDDKSGKAQYAWYKVKIKKGEIIVPGVSVPVAPNSDTDDSEIEVQETIEASLSLERDLHNYLSKQVNQIENGLVLVDNGIEYKIEAGQIDLLAKDNQGNSVVIELKAGKAKDSAVGQLLGYMGCLSSISPEHVQVRGILVAADFEQRVVYAARGLQNIKLVKYKVSFELQEIK